MKQILQKVECDSVEFGASCDLKMCLILCGKQTASSRYPCPYCYGKEPYSVEAERTTLGSLHEWYLKFIEAGGDIAKAKEYMNVPRKPLLAGNPGDMVLDILIPPELNCMTGVAEKIIKELERTCFVTRKAGKLFVDNFLKKNNIKKCVYKGSKSFEGNQARKLLQVCNNNTFKL